MFSPSITFCKSHTKLIQKNGQHETTTKEMNKMIEYGRTKHRFQQLKKELTTQSCLAHYNGNKETLSQQMPVEPFSD